MLSYEQVLQGLLKAKKFRRKIWLSSVYLFLGRIDPSDMGDPRLKIIISMRVRSCILDKYENCDYYPCSEDRNADDWEEYEINLDKKELANYNLNSVFHQLLNDACFNFIAIERISFDKILHFRKNEIYLKKYALALDRLNKVLNAYFFIGQDDSENLCLFIYDHKLILEDMRKLTC